MSIIERCPLERAATLRQLSTRIVSGVCMQTLESPPPLGHSVTEYRELLERSDVDLGVHCLVRAPCMASYLKKNLKWTVKFWNLY
jgi:hypothetical protein